MRTIQIGKPNWAGHILIHNCVIKIIIDGKLGKGEVVEGGEWACWMT